jgi:hypothetical protein
LGERAGHDVDRHHDAVGVGLERRGIDLLLSRVDGLLRLQQGRLVAGERRLIDGAVALSKLFCADCSWSFAVATCCRA